MTTGLFWLAALALVALAWSALWTAQRRPAASDAGPGRSNIRLLDEQLEALRADHRRGAIDADRWQQGSAEIERRLLDESGDAAHGGARSASIDRKSSNGSARTGALTLAALALLLPAAAAGGYLLLGNPAALNAAATVANEPAASTADVQAMVETLASRMRARPPGQADDLPGWTMLARSLAALQRFDESASAFERAIALAPNDASLLVDLADVLATRRGPGGVAATGDRAAGLLTRALEIDPNNVKALALAGNAAFERHDTSAAIDFWRHARALVPVGSDFAAGLDQNLVEAGAAPGGVTPSGMTPGGSARASVAPGSGLESGGVGVGSREAGGRVAGGLAAGGLDAGGGVVAGSVAPASVRGVVRIAGGLASRVAPGDTVFIFARDANGPPMPLAVLRRTAGELPITFTLDDSLAMSPERRLSQAERLVVGARVSRSGEALPQSGDLIGQVEAVVGGRAVEVVLDGVQR